ncbi:MAG: right-handed parallel beta-helix repeat-containing protein [Pirellulaceae bacterium]|nr:right-handed parallel beta-helix repeat-containing protein [Pirellulaceae bacterium]
MKRRSFNAFRSAFRRSSNEQRDSRRRKLHLEQLETRRVLTLPATQTFAEGETLVYNGPTVDVVNDSLSFDAFVDFAGDVDSYFFAPQFSGSYTIDVGDFGNVVDPEVAVYIASTGAQIGYNNDVSLFNDDAQLMINLVADVRYIIAVADAPNTAAGNLSIIISAPFRTGSFLLLPDSFGDTTAPVLLDVNTDIDYYSITAPPDATGGIVVSATASTFDHRFALFNSAGTLLQGPLVSIAATGVSPGQEYRIAVYSNDYASAGTLTMNVNFAQTGVAVTNTLDAGPGSLRQAILDANAHPNDPGTPDKIRFAIPGAGPHNIVLSSALPFITDTVDLDGGTQPGTAITPTVAIDGTALVGAVDGLRILAAGTAIRKLNIRKFPGDGIEVQASGVLLERNTIGTDWRGVTALGNRGNGIFIQGGSMNTIASNVVSGNNLNGIAINGNGADGNTLDGNTIGARFGGSVALPNAANGIVVTDGDLNDITSNTISGNTLSGIVLTGSANSNTITHNKIGTRTSGAAALPNGGEGILIQSSGNQIGGNRVGLRNIISGNGKTGISITGATASNNVVEGNYIGTNLTGTAAIPNISDGIRVTDAANNRIGSATVAAAGNLISGNGGSGITFSQANSTGGLAVGNLIGTTANGLSALGNVGSGVLINGDATNVQIGGTTAISRNVISANGASGVTIAINASNNRVSRNRIGVNLAGAPLGNASSGVLIQGPNNTIGGVNSTFTNIIGGNANGITLSGVAATDNGIRFNTIGTDAAPNIGRGIQFIGNASGNTIGPKNTIRRNESGIRVNNGSIENKITQNSISDNTNLGIDLFPSAGVTPNDAADADNGGNRLQNFPQISGNPLLLGTNLEIAFSVPSATTNSAYPLTIEFFVSDSSGEGATFLGSTIYTAANFAAGIKTVSFAGAGAGLTPGVTKIVGHATDLVGNSSEFSSQRTLAAGIALGRFSVPALQSNQLDVNQNGVVNSSDATSLIAFLNSNPLNSPEPGALRSTSDQFDTDGDGRVNPQDVLLVVRALQSSKSNPQAVDVIDQLSGKEIWDIGLVELMTKDLPDVRKSLSASRWVKLV